MIQPKAKIGSNVQVNFNSSAEIKEWSKKYNTTVEEIRQICSLFKLHNFFHNFEILIISYSEWRETDFRGMLFVSGPLK
jgi:hypothetical protein